MLYVKCQSITKSFYVLNYIPHINFLLEIELTIEIILVFQEKKGEMNQSEVKYLYPVQVNSLEKSNYIGGLNK